MDKNEAFAALWAEIPATGEIDFDDMRKNLILSDKVQALDVFHPARRDKRITCRHFVKPDGTTTLMVSRPVVK